MGTQSRRKFCSYILFFLLKSSRSLLRFPYLLMHLTLFFHGKWHKGYCQYIMCTVCIMSAVANPYFPSETTYFFAFDNGEYVFLGESIWSGGIGDWESFSLRVIFYTDYTALVTVLQNETSLYDVDWMFECLLCPEGCDTCEDDRPCVVSLNWLMRSAILILQCAIIAMLPIVGLFTWKYSNVKVSLERWMVIMILSFTFSHSIIQPLFDSSALNVTFFRKERNNSYWLYIVPMLLVVLWQLSLTYI
jgi:hypothetical protein